MQPNTQFQQITGARLPIIMAPMFLVSNVGMMQSAMRAGIVGVFPSLNFRGDGELASVIESLYRYRKESGHRTDFGVNLIVQKTNPLLERHLDVCVSQKVPFYITSLGSPKVVIERARTYGARVFCDVTNLEHAAKCVALGCDGFVAVGQGAGGHAGPHPLTVLVPALRKKWPGIPVVAAGGVATGEGVISMLALGASAVSIGTRFIASTEATVPESYKQAVLESGMADIVMTERLSGTPCTIINTPYAQKIGYTQNAFEKWLGKNETTRKYFKMMVQVRGLKRLEQAVKPGNYKNLWCAGKSVELIDAVRPCSEIVSDLEREMELCMTRMSNGFNSQ
jgi:nitronate monooxygenase